MFLRRKGVFLSAAFMFVVSLTGAYADAVIGNSLTQAMKTAKVTDLIATIATYRSQPVAADVQALRNAGVRYGVVLQKLPMAGVWATKAQIQTIAAQPNVRSLYLNAPLQYFNREGTAMIGAVKQRTMPGWGYSGRGVGVAIVDSGIDATHPDLPLGSHVKQNVKVVVGPSLDTLFAGIVPPIYVENLPDTDGTSGHGTHCAGIVGGLGTQSGGLYAGVAPGADLIGVSTGETIAVLWALEGWDYVLTHRFLYNIKVVSNSWGTGGSFDPEDPINVASKILHDNGMTVVFASGNEGPGSNTLNPYSVAPWVIGVAAGDKQGKLADFSSRGVSNDPLYHPGITAPGVSIVSCRAKGSVLGAASGDIIDDPNLPPAAIPYYAHLSGTSMATPSIAGCCALLLEANPKLTPDQIKAILRSTATPMAGYAEYQVGAGYVNVLAALDRVRNPGKPYGAVLNQTYNARFAGYVTNEVWDQDWDPLASPPQHAYSVGKSGVLSDVFITWDNPANTFNLAVTDPAGTTTSTGSDLLAAVYGLHASLSFPKPMAGSWHTTIYGIRGQSSGTTGIGVFDTIHGRVLNYYGAFSGLNDVGNSPYAPYIRRAVTSRLMDSATATTFRPNANVTRGETARIIASACDVRQNLPASLPYADVSASLAPFVAAVTSPGGPIRDIYLQTGPIMTGGTAVSFNPNGAVIRAELAVWLVRALGLEAEAQSNMHTATTYTDDALIPAWARGYVVVASNIGLMTGFANASVVEGAPVTYSWKPSQPVTRGAMAATIVLWHDLFMQPAP